ncbi:hypothetical protein [Vibrio navarrensis]|uniref:hypothetical protein n=1 Tax=Vibrio navarrensis TaxID=29495 RepID=UPI0018DC74D0|nr:hypothetical protein [Vibrio navarrensis]MBH9739023.1 hypothetical protein [Vibrio navarrensis]
MKQIFKKSLYTIMSCFALYPSFTYAIESCSDIGETPPSSVNEYIKANVDFITVGGNNPYTGNALYNNGRMTKAVKVEAEGKFYYDPDDKDVYCKFDMNGTQFSYYVKLGLYEEGLNNSDYLDDLKDIEGFNYDMEEAGKDGRTYEHNLDQNGVMRIANQKANRSDMTSTFYVEYDSDNALGVYHLCAYTVDNGGEVTNFSNCNSNSADQNLQQRELIIMDGEYRSDFKDMDIETFDNEICDSGWDCSVYIDDLGRDFETQVNTIANSFEIYRPIASKANLFRGYDSANYINNDFVGCTEYKEDIICTDNGSKDNVRLFTRIVGRTTGDGRAIIKAVNEKGGDDGHEIRVNSPLYELSDNQGYFALATTKYDFDDEDFSISEPNYDSPCDFTEPHYQIINSGKLTDDYGNQFKLEFKLTGPDDTGCVNRTGDPTLTNLD